MKQPLIILFLVVACHGVTAFPLTVTEKASQRKAALKELTIKGNRKVNQRQIQEWFQVGKGDRVSPNDFRARAFGVLQYFHEQGFYFATLDSLEFDYDHDSSSVKVVVHVTEGDLLKVSSLEIEGLPKTEAGWIEELSTRPGSTFFVDELQQDIDTILRRYENRGYPYCKVEIADLSRNNDDLEELAGIDIRLKIIPGPLTRVDEIEIVGNDVTKDYVILRELDLEPGQTYDQRKLDEVVPRLMKLGYFKWANPPRLVRQANQTGKLIIEVGEGSHNRFDGVIGYNPPTVASRGFVTGLIDLSFGNLLGTGREAEVFWQRRTEKTQELKLAYTEPWVANLPLNVSLSFAQLIQDTSFVERNLTLETRFRVNPDLSFFSRFGKRSVSPDSLGAVLFGIPRSTSTNLSLGVAFNTLDYRPNPTSGVSYQTSLEWRRKKLGSSRFDVESETDPVDGSFDQRLVAIDFETYFSTFRWQVFALALRGRQITSDEGAIAISDQFRFGGTRDLRGYREEQFRGSRLAWANIEYRYLLNRTSRLFTFVDVGYFSRKEAETRLNAAKVGFGMGMKIETRLGFFGIDYGLGQGDGLSNGKVHVSLRNAF
ncbi:BamA/TamA family outer membrane protein [bacterium]|nr:BamA/TamA family outer membrane protein [bacterium]